MDFVQVGAGECVEYATAGSAARGASLRGRVTNYVSWAWVGNNRALNSIR